MDSLQIAGVSGEAKFAQDEGEIVVEPRFKYERVLGDVARTLEKDSASCVAVHDKFLAIGFSSGRIGFFDHFGNGHFECTTKNHRCSVSHIAVDGAGNYVISCANDKQVCIQGFGHSDYNQNIDVYPAAKCVALSEDFSKYGSGQRFITANQCLTLHECGFFKKQKTLLYQGMERDGLITFCSWKNSLIAFTNETGTRIYDCNLKRLISLIQPSQHPDSRTSHFPPRHIWIDSLNLIISWGNSIFICHVTTQSKDAAGLPYKKVEIINQWTINDFYIAGISFTTPESQVCEQSWEEIVLFGFAISDRTDEADTSAFDDTRSVFSDVTVFSTMNMTQDKQTNAQFMLLKPTTMTKYSISLEDIIEMKNVDIRFLKRFFLCSLPSDKMYFLLGTRELIEAQPCSIDDRVAWLVENELFAEALQCALKDPDALSETSVAEIGRRLIEDLIKKDQFILAAEHLSEVCGRCKQEWEYYCEIFEKHGEILKLVPFIPTSAPQLEPECYEWILTAALYARAQLFKRLVLEWNPDIYRAASIIDKILKRISDENSKGPKETTLKTQEDAANLYQSLAHLLAYVRNFQKAIDIYLLLKDKAIFGVINRYNLFYLVKDRIVELMQIDEDLARTILIENADFIPVQQVIAQLNKHPKLQMLYLNRLHARGEANDYSDLMIRLFAEYERKMLLPFLKKCENYKLDQALDVCKRKNFVEEMIYLLGRSGNQLEALDVIMTKLDKIDAAIAFCAEHDDIELWNRLIDLCVNKPKHITKLLATTGTFIDPLIVIKKIPTDIEIPGLQKALLKVLRDYELQISLLCDSSKVGLEDLLRLFEERVKSGLSSTFIDSDQKCYLCSESIVSEIPDSKAQHEILFLGCGHILHRRCLETDSTKVTDFTCPSCFMQCRLDEELTTTKKPSPQKTIPNSISQADISNIWMN